MPSKSSPCAALLLVVQVAFSSAPADSVQPSKVIPTEGSRNDSPALEFDGRGRLWLAWPSYQDGRYRLAVTSRSPAGVTAPIDYPDASRTDQVDPVWAFAPGGIPRIVYSAHDGTQWTVRTVECPPEDPHRNPTIVGRGSNPTAAVAGGRLWIAWQQDPNIALLVPGGTEADTADDSARGPSATAAFIGETHVRKPSDGMIRLSRPLLCAGPDGAVWLVWEAARPGYRSIRLQRIDEPGHEPLTADAGSGINRHPSMSIDSGGRVWLVFEELREIEALDVGAGSNGPSYVYDRRYDVTKPSRAVLVTDGRQWWAPAAPSAPAWGLAPSLLCSRAGGVWLLSRRFTNRFPLCEYLGPDGWENHRGAWTDQRSYKEAMPLAESPDGTVWTAWAQHERRNTAGSEAPAWSLLDGPDTIMIASMPAVKRQGAPRLVSRRAQTSNTAQAVVFPSYETEYRGETLKVYFGDMHVHSEFSGCGRWNGTIEEDVAYCRDIRGLDFYAPGDHAEHLNDHNWHACLVALRTHDRPGAFVPYMAFEWTSEFDRGGNLYRGHYNPVFRQLGAGERYFSASDPRTNTPLELWTALRSAVGGPENVLTFPHHPSRRAAWVSWSYYDPEMAPIIEIAQVRGSYEYEGCPRGLVLDGDCNRAPGHFVQDALARGMRFGIAAGGDHGGRQLTAVFAPALDRDSLFRGMRAKRTYGTSGERMFLDARVNEHFMGEEFALGATEARMITLNAKGTTPLTQVDLFRNGRIIRNWTPRRMACRITYADPEPLCARDNYYYVRLTQEDGGLAWSSPTWVVNRSVSGEFRFQIGGDELHVVYPDRETDLSVLMHNETDSTVEATVTLEAPAGWTIKEGPSIDVRCPTESWTHAVFNVTAPEADLAKLCLPRLTARCRQADGTVQESPLFVVGSPDRITPENKAKLMEARRALTPQQFREYLDAASRIWKE